MKKRLALALCAALLLLYAIVPACADQAVETARPSVNGRLHVEGPQLTEHNLTVFLDEGDGLEIGALKDLWQNIAYRVARTIR